MSDSQPASGSRAARLGEAIAAYEQAVQNGRTPSPALWLACYPDLTEELRDWLQRRRSGVSGATLAQPAAGSSTKEPAPPAQVAALQFEDYELQQPLGEGCKGVVWKARQKSLKRLVAIKVVRRAEFGSADAVHRFRMEAEAVAQLDHPGIVPIYEIGETAEALFFSMKLIEGGSLEAGLTGASGTCLRSAEVQRRAAAVLAGVGHAVHYAHQLGILHRDLKPANILLDRDGNPVVIDFGIAKRILAEDFPAAPVAHVESANRTALGILRGTPAFMAPEQASPGGRLTTATDVYGLGAVLYYLLTGRLLFEAETVPELLQHVRERSPLAPRKLDPRIHPDLEAICLRCLNKDPAERYDSARAFAQDLERWLAGQPVTARPLPAQQRFFMWARRQPLVAGLATAVFGTALLGSLLVLWQWSAAVHARQTAETALETAKKDRDEAQTQQRVADTEKVRAQKEETRANGERKRAETERERAEQREQEARLAETRALAEKARAESERLRALTLRYAIQLNQIQRELQEDDYLHYLRAEELLRQCDPELRGWEHDYLQGQVALRLRSFDLEGSAAASQTPTRNRDGSPTTIRALALSGDGTLIAVANGTRVTILDSATGAERAAMKSLPRGSPTALAFSPKGGLLAASFWAPVGSQSERVCVWDAGSGDLRFRIVESQMVTAFAFSPDGGTLALACGASGGPGERNESEKPGEVVLWDVASGKETGRLSGHTVPVDCLAFHPNGLSLASAGNSGADADRKNMSVREVKLWDVLKRAERTTWSDVKNHIYALAFRPDGGALAIGGNNTVQLRDTESGQELADLRIPEQHASVTALDWTSDGLTLIAVYRSGFGWDSDVVFWDAALEVPRSVCRRPKNARGNAAVRGDGKLLVLANDSTVTTWSPDSSSPFRSWKGHDTQVTGLALSRDGRLLASVSGAHQPPRPIKGDVKLWNAGNLKPLRTIAGADVFVAISPDGKQIAAHYASSNSPREMGGSSPPPQEIGIWDADSGELDCRLAGHKGGVWSAAFLSGNLLLTGGGRGWGSLDVLPRSPPLPETAILWDFSTGMPIESLEGVGPFVAASAEGLAFASAQGNSRFGLRSTFPVPRPTVNIWDAATRKTTSKLAHLPGGLRSVAFSPEGRFLAASWMQNGDLTLWRIADDKPIPLQSSHQEIVNGLAFTRDGRRLATASADHTIKLWDTTTGIELLSLEGPPARATSIVFGPDDARLIVGYAGGTLASFEAPRAAISADVK